MVLPAAAQFKNDLAIRERYDTVLREVSVGGNVFTLLVVRDTNALVDAIDPAAFAADERFPYWADLWVSSVALAGHLTGLAAGTRVLELGCGLGLAGIAAARAGATVTLTDIDPDALRFAAENAALNLEPDQRERVTIAPMDWRDPVPQAQFDLVIGADIVYERRFFEPLLALLPRVIAPGGAVLLAEPDRAVGRDFLAQARAAGWTVSTSRISRVWNGAPVTVTLNTLTAARTGGSAGA
jgi:predicted nicotinamide N-methyase